MNADFLQQSDGSKKTGSVTLIRDIKNREKWHKLDLKSKILFGGPELAVMGVGETLEEAIINANLAAAHAKTINI